MTDTKVKDVMTKNPEIISPESTILEACRKMKELDCGCLPVGTEEETEGMITDRDIVIRAISEGKDPATTIVRDFMTDNLRCCGEDDSLADAAKFMHEYDVSRLAVENADGRITGILSFGHVLRSTANDEEVTQMVYCATGRKAA